MIHTVIMQSGHTDPTLFYISTKIQSTATSNEYIITKYVPETIMPLKYHINNTQAN